MRGYFAADASDLLSLQGGSKLIPKFHIAESDDEADEFDAMSAAAALATQLAVVGRHTVVAAEVDRPDQSVGLDDVAAFHVDADGSGDLAWYSTEEIEKVIELLG